MKAIAITIGFGLMLSACASANAPKLTDDARNVLRARSLSDVAGCKRIAEVKGSASANTAFVWAPNPYGPPAPIAPQIVNEILIDARNQAARLGGNRILASDEPAGYQQDFDVYNCP